MKRRSFMQGVAASVTASICAPTVLRPNILADNEITLCLDWSSSMYSTSALRKGPAPLHYRVQRDGHVEAVLSGPVSKLLIEKQPYVYVILWAAALEEVTAIFQGRITTRANVEALAAAIKNGVPRVEAESNLTKHSVPLRAMMSRFPQTGARRIIDISTDEAPKNQFDEAESRAARDAFIATGGTVNVYAVDPRESDLNGLRRYVQDPNGFTLVANTWEEYAAGLKLKMERELLTF